MVAGHPPAIDDRNLIAAVCRPLTECNRFWTVWTLEVAEKPEDHRGQDQRACDIGQQRPPEQPLGISGKSPVTALRFDVFAGPPKPQLAMKSSAPGMQYVSGPLGGAIARQSMAFTVGGHDRVHFFIEDALQLSIVCTGRRSDRRVNRQSLSRQLLDQIFKQPGNQRRTVVVAIEDQFPGGTPTVTDVLQ